jgi:Uma2 family endonuclease
MDTSAATSAVRPTSVVGMPAAPTAPKPVSWQEFQRKYLQREDGYKYEWINGVVEKTKRGMDKTQLFILRNLQDFFIQLKVTGKISGQLIAEPDLFFLVNHRRPDIVWLTNDQIDRLAYNSNDIPAFIIEVISTYDQINRVQNKMENYRHAGVQVVWHIFPNLATIHVYGGQRLDVMNVLTGDQICSAAPVLPDFALPVNEILKKPAKPNH